MALLSKKDQDALRKEFGALTRPVKLVVFTQELECQYCRETRAIAEELAGLSDRIRVEVYDLVRDADQAKKYNIDKIPAIALVVADDAETDYGIRLYGIPSGYEFGTLVQDILMVSQGDSGLSAASKTALAQVKQPVRFQVFITPTCPYCPPAVHLAHQMAMENPLVQADMVEAIEFPHLAQKYQVMGVPRTVINDTVHIEGAVPERVLLQKVMEAAGLTVRP